MMKIEVMMKAIGLKWQGLLVMGLIAVLLAGCGSRSNPESNRSANTRADENTNIGASATANGSELFNSLDCIHCHQMNGRGPGPSLAGIYGTSITLASGESVTVDEEYIRTSILDPRAQIHEGYQPMMPPFAGRVNDEELAALVEYIRSLSE